MNESIRPSKVCQNAISLIEVGWCTKSLMKFINGKTHHCLYSAIHNAAHTPRNPGRDVSKRISETTEQVISSVAQEIGEGGNQDAGNRIGLWNDRQRDKRAVIRMLEKVKAGFEATEVTSDEAD